MLSEMSDLNREFNTALRRVLSYLIYANDADRIILGNLLATLTHDHDEERYDQFRKQLATIDRVIDNMRLSTDQELDIAHLDQYLLGTKEDNRDLRHRVMQLEKDFKTFKYTQDSTRKIRIERHVATLASQAAEPEKTWISLLTGSDYVPPKKVKRGRPRKNPISIEVTEHVDECEALGDVKNTLGDVKNTLGDTSEYLAGLPGVGEPVDKCETFVDVKNALGDISEGPTGKPFCRPSYMRNVYGCIEQAGRPLTSDEIVTMTGLPTDKVIKALSNLRFSQKRSVVSMKEHGDYGKTRYDIRRTQE